IMIVDDEPSLVTLAEETLAELGYEGVGFDSSVAALAAFRESPQRFDAVLSDETMPELAGSDLVLRIRALRPAIPVILMSRCAGHRRRRPGSPSAHSCWRAAPGSDRPAKGRHRARSRTTVSDAASIAARGRSEFGTSLVARTIRRCARAARRRWIGCDAGFM